MPDSSLLSTLLMFAVMGLAFWLLLIRPAQRKQKAQQDLVSKLDPGARVMTTAGVMATIREVGERTAIIEISPGVEMTILKQAIMRTVEPAEEEFEYADDQAADAALETGSTGFDPSGFDSVRGFEASGPLFDPERPVDPDQKTN